MEIDIGRGKKGRRAYGFDDIAIVPSRRTRDPDDIDISWTLGPYRFELPLVASAMDGVVSPDTTVLVNELGGLGVLNLDAIQITRQNKICQQRLVPLWPHCRRAGRTSRLRHYRRLERDRGSRAVRLG